MFASGIERKTSMHCPSCKKGILYYYEDYRSCMVSYDKVVVCNKCGKKTPYNCEANKKD